MIASAVARRRPAARALLAQHPALAIAAGWSVVALAAAVQAMALARLPGGPSLTAALVGRLSLLPFWALATPFVLRSARRFPIAGAGTRPSPAHLLLHLTAASVFIVATNVAVRLPLLWGAGPAALWRSTARGLAEFFPAALLAYAVLVLLGHLVGGAAAADVTGPSAEPRGVAAERNGEAMDAAQRNAEGMDAVEAAEWSPAHRNGDAPAAERGDIVFGGGPPMVVAAARDLAPTLDPPETANSPRPASIDASTTVTPPSAESREPSAESRAKSAPSPEYLPVRQWNRVHLVRITDIDWIAAEDNYVVVHAGGRGFKGRERIADVEARLDARRFVRIHRSTIVHVARIREVQPLTHGDHAVVLRDGTVLRVARSRRQALESALALEL